LDWFPVALLLCQIAPKVNAELGGMTPEKKRPNAAGESKKRARGLAAGTLVLALL